jgi:serine/threonine-protein kinase HipA
MNELLVLLDGREVGNVRQIRGRLSFAYADSWRSAQGAYPLSLSMPLAAQEHPHGAIEPFIWGLLPDNEFVLNRWAKQFHVSPRNAFALISHVGEDCAGAVQFVTPDRREEMTTAPPVETQWLTETEVASRLRVLQSDASAGRAPSDTGQFSLAGAQPKTALLFDGQRWGVPSGRTPTTHILKPPTGGFDGHAENEHLCLKLAQALGLPTANSEVRKFENVTAIVVERYDRVNISKLAVQEAALAAAKAAEVAMHAGSNDPNSAARAAQLVAEIVDAAASAKSLSEFAKTTQVYRVHQEDFCQALRIHPSLKYQNDGGPGPRQIVELLRANASSANRSKDQRIPTAKEDDVSTFLDALILNWLIGGTDAHAKNYSILIGGGGLVRLAPLYDIASVLAYDDIDPKKAKLAMKIGQEYKLQSITLSDWRELVASIRFDEPLLIDRIRAMAKALPDLLTTQIKQLSDSGINHQIIDRLAKVLPQRAVKISTL